MSVRSSLMKEILILRSSARLSLLLPITLMLLIACSSEATSQKNPTYNSQTTSSSASVLAASSFTYQPTPGPYTVEVADNLTLRKSNGQSLPLKIYYPQGKGPFPVIIFSHGGGGSKDFYAPLGEYWASNGYITIHPTHADSVSLRGKEFMRELGDYAMKNSQGWIERATDISLIISSLKQLEQKVPQLQRQMDLNRIGVGGHSFGAYTAQLVGGATIDIPNGPKQKSLADKRIKAVLLMSPQGEGQQGLTASSWQSWTLPMMVMTGTNDRIGGGRGPEWRRQPFDAAPPGDKYLVFIKGANHFSFGGRSADKNSSLQSPGISNNFPMSDSSSGSLRERIRARVRQRIMQQRMQGQSDPNVDQKAIFDYVKMGSLAFWDAYLMSKPQAKQYLKSQELSTYSQGDAIVSIR